MDKNPDVRSETLTNRLLDEGVMLVVRAAELEGIRICSKTAIRWCLAGVRGIRLENLKVRGRRMTSRAANAPVHRGDAGPSAPGWHRRTQFRSSTAMPSTR